MNRLLFVPLLAAAAAAQTVVVYPADHATREGSSSVTNRPLSAGISRMQLIYSKWRTPLPNGAQIARVGFRPDVLGTGGGHQLQLEIWMGHSTLLHSTASTTFDNNYDVAPAVRVYDPKTFALPTVPQIANGPQTTYVWIPLDRTFTYDASKNLVVEYRISANSNGNAAFSYRLDLGSFVSPTTTFGTACPTSNSRLPAITTQPTAVGSNMAIALSNGPASSAGVLVIGLSNTTWNGVPLPLPLAAFGAGTCSLQVAIDANVAIATGTTGAFNGNLPIPNVLAMSGHWIYVQAALADLFANPAGFVTSASGGTQLGAQPQATLIAAVGNATAPTGTRSVNYGLISVFEF